MDFLKGKQRNQGVVLKRIGLFGGTFNPIHRGHLQVVQDVQKAFSLERILLVPSALPPHKESGSLADAPDRMNMIRLAVANNPALMQFVSVSDVELKRFGPSYTIDTVRHLKQNMPQDMELYLILGLDAFLEIDTWKSYRELFLLVPFIVMTRAGAGQTDDSMAKMLGNYLRSNISDGYRFSAAQVCYVDDSKQPVFVFKVTPVDISSTKIRGRIKSGRSVASMVPKEVEDYIKSKGLYS